MITKSIFLLFALSVSLSCLTYGQKQIKLKKKERKRDIEIVTTAGTMIVRLSDSTPLHRDNFLMLVKTHYYDSMLFHRVIERFMIQGGDPDSKRAVAGKPLGEGGPGYTIRAEFNINLFHKKGVIAAARESDNVNPQKASSGSQFYIVQGKKYTDGALDTLEQKRLKRKIPVYQREVYKTLGGVPFLDQNYTVFGEVIRELETIDTIAAVSVSKGEDKNRPLQDIRIIDMRLVKRQ